MNYIKKFSIFFILLFSSFVYAKETPLKLATVFLPGRTWTYKVFVISPKKDTTDTITATLEISKKDAQNIQAKWEHNNTSELAEILKGAFGTQLNPPITGKFQPLNLYISPSYSEKLCSVSSIFKHPQDIVYTCNGKSVIWKELDCWQIGKPFNGEDLEIQYVPKSERKDVTTLMQTFPGCLEIKAERVESKPAKKTKTEDLKAVFYCHPEYGFVRWEYLKPDSSRIVFDLENMTESTPPMSPTFNARVEVELSGALADRKRIEWPLPPYPDWALQKEVSATFAVQVKVDSTGRMSETPTISQSTGYFDWDKSIVMWIKDNWKWEKIPSSETQGSVKINFIYVK